MSISWQDNRVRRLAADALFLALAMGLSYLEYLLPVSLVIPLPGFKLGLANLLVMIAIPLLSPIDAALISATRILLSGLLFGSVTSLYFSALGGFCSYAVLLLLHLTKAKCSFVGRSVLSAALHNCGQMLAAVTLFGPAIAKAYLPPLLFASILYGGALGILTNLVYPRVERAVRGKEGAQ